MAMVKRPLGLMMANVALVLTAALVVGWSSSARAELRPEELSKVEGAKKEGVLSIYTTINDTMILLQGFNRKYPFLKAEVYRAGSDRLLTRMLAESRAKKYFPDVFFSSSLDSQIVRKDGLAKKYVSPESAVYAEEFKDPDGFWTSCFMITRVLAYNTKLVNPKDVPKRYEDLLDPKWKGQLGLPSDEVGWFAAQLKIMGREKGIEFFKRLAKQNIRFQRGKNLSVQLLAASEFPILLMTSSHFVEHYKRQGAAVEWVAIEPVPTSFSQAVVLSHAPHPNAAMLFADYALSKEGQEIIRGANRISLRPDVPPNPPRLIRGLKFLPEDPEWLGKEYYQLYREIFSGR